MHSQKLEWLVVKIVLNFFNIFILEKGIYHKLYTGLVLQTWIFIN